MAKADNTLLGVIRTTTGKGSSHRLRKAGMIPGVVYAGGKSALSVAVDPKDAQRILRTPLRRNILMQLELQTEHGEQAGHKNVMVKDLQIDLVKRTVSHLDFVETDPTLEMVVSVPMNLIGKSKSVVEGGRLEQVEKKLRVRCLPTQIPEKIDFDVTELPFGSTHTHQVQLPAGVALAEDPNASIITIRIPKAEKEETPADAAAAAATPAAAPAAAA